jgi:hypothetical protein
MCPAFDWTWPVLGVMPAAFETIESAVPETFDATEPAAPVTASRFSPTHPFVRAGTLAL